MKKYLFLIATAAAFVACSNEEGQKSGVAEQQSDGDEITFSIDVPAETRANNTSTLISGEENFYVWADQVEMVNAVSSLREGFINAWKLQTANPSTSLTTTGTTYNWPVINRLRFYAIHGNFSGSHSTITANTSPFPKSALTEDEAAVETNLGPLTHTVPEVQTNTSQGNLNYQKADLLYAVVPTTGMVNPVPLHFYHMMSKLVIKIVKGQGITLSELNTATVQIVRVKNKVTFLPKKLKLTEGEVSDLLTEDGSDLTNAATRGATLAGMMSLPSQDLVDISLSTNINEYASGTKTEAAILVPQEFDSNNTEAGIKITWNSKVYLVPFTGLTFEPGKVYTYNITLDHVGTSYDFNPSISTWGANSNIAVDVASGS